MKKKLKDLLNYEQPQKYIVSTENYSDDFTTPVLTAGKSFILGYTDETEGIFNGTKEPVIIFDDFTRDTKYVDFDFKVKSSAMKILHKANKEDSLKYLYYAIQKIDYKPFSHKRLWISDFSNFAIDYKNPIEQQRIATILDKIQSAINNKKQQLSLLDEAVKSEFVEMFGENPIESGKWKVEKLKALSKSGGTYGAQSASSEYKNNRPRYIRITDINEDGSLNDDVVCSSNNDDDDTYKLVKGDFLFARMGATVGKTYAYSSGDMIFAGYLIRFQLNTEKIHPSFLFYFTKTEWYQKWVKNNQSGAAQPGINSNKYGNLSVPVPPLDLQNQFAAFVQKIDKSKSLVKQQLADLQELLDSKMQEYFS